MYCGVFECEVWCCREGVIGFFGFVGEFVDLVIGLLYECCGCYKGEVVV